MGGIRHLALRRCFLAFMLALLSCATVQQPQSKLLKRVGRGKIDPAELRIQVRALAGQFSGSLEVLGDTIVAGAPDNLRTRMLATRFKINSISAMQSALFQPDPVAALIDGWALLAQLRQALQALELKDARVETLANQTFGNMEAEVEQIWRRLTGRSDITADRNLVNRWAEAHPIEGSAAARQSTAGILSSLTAQSGVTLMGAAASLLNNTADLTSRLDLEAAYFPKQARWQAEYVLLETLMMPGVAKAADDAGNLLASLSAATQSVPQLIERERNTAFDALHQERIGAQDFFRQERNATMADLRVERTEVLAEADRMVSHWEDRGIEAATKLLDRAFRWLLLLVGVVLLGVVVIVLVLSDRSTSRHHRGGMIERRQT